MRIGERRRGEGEKIDCFSERVNCVRCAAFENRIHLGRPVHLDFPVILERL